MTKRPFILFFLVVATLHPSLAQEVHVSPTGGNVYPYDSLANAATNVNVAVASAPSGAVVLVHSGTYVLTNSLVITNTLSIVGVDGANATVLDGNDRATCILSHHPETLIEGLTVQNGRGTYLTSSDGGGGIFLESGGVVRACTIINNRSSYYGGGIGFRVGYGLVDQCVIVSNISAYYGGGVTLGNDSELRNSLVAYNHAENGGGVHSDGNTPRIRNSTIAYNEAVSAGGGLYVRGGAFGNNIIYYNGAKVCSNWYDYRGGSGLMSNTCTFPAPYGVGNIPDPPAFVNSDGGDFTLRPNSLCIDAGQREDWMETATDLNNSFRVVGPAPDMGAYEYQSSNLYISIQASPRRGIAPLKPVFMASTHHGDVSELFYAWDLDNDGGVDVSGWGLGAVTTEYDQVGTFSIALAVSNATGAYNTLYSNMVSVSPADIYVSRDGLNIPPFTNLATASTNIQSALDIAMDGANVWLDQGIYQLGAPLFHCRPVAIRSIHGKEMTVLDGQGQNTVIQLWHPQAEVESVTIINGNGSMGGGIAAFSGGRIADAAVVSNKAQTGGGCYALGEVCITNCEIAFNVAPGLGGGVEIHGGTIAGCCVRNNSSSNFGGGIDLHGGNLISNVITANRGHSGGGIFVYGSGTIDRCAVVSNVATASSVWLSGGGITWSYGGGLIANTLMAWNEGCAGGGLRVDLAQVNIVNCTIAHNRASLGAGVYHRNPVWTTYTNSIISHNDGDDFVTVFEMVTGWPYPRCEYTDPGLDVIFSDVPRGDFRLRWDSPGINAGTNLPEQIDGLDLDGKPRILDGIVDRGAYEQYPPDQDTDGDGLPDGWEWQYFGGITNASPNGLGADGMFSSMDHCIAGTDPHDPASFPQFEDIVVGEADDSGKVVLHWASYPGRVYSLYRCNDLTVGLFESIAINLSANSPENTYIDEGATGVGPWVYRLGIRLAE